MLWILCNELLYCRPQSLDRDRRIVDVNDKSISFVVDLHEFEDIVVNVAEELNLGLNSPIPSVFSQSRMPIEHAGVPSAHLMISNVIIIFVPVGSSASGGT